MRHFTLLILLGCVFFLSAQNDYQLSADSKRKEHVIYGEHISAEYNQSKIFPGTRRQVDVYVPAQYDGRTPACVCVFQDGLGFHADTVISNLIEDSMLPVMILVAASPGIVTGDFDSGSMRANRTYEYDTPSSRFGRFLLDELLPFVETLTTQDGRKISFSKDRDDRMITGCSSGAACAFNAAWFTGEFSRVFSACGSYTGLRGSFANSTLVSKFETKPIRFYFQSGSEDMWTAYGDWWSANQAMVRAMQFAGYDFKYQFTDQTKHCDQNVTQLFPDAMRFLWSGYPENKPTPKAPSRNYMLEEILIPASGFTLVADVGRTAADLVSDDEGRLLLSKPVKTVLLDDYGNVQRVVCDSRLLVVGKDGQKLCHKAGIGIVLLNDKGKMQKKLSSNIYPSCAVALKNGGYFIAGSKLRHEQPHIIWLLTADGILTEVDSGLKGVCSIALSGNENWLYAFEYATRRGFSYKVIKESQHADFKQEFFFIHMPDECDGAETLAAVCDIAGRTYLATAFGVQVGDYNGRCAAILPLSAGAKPVSIAWGGKDLDILYVLGDNGQLFQRKMNAKGFSIRGEMPIIRVGAG